MTDEGERVMLLGEEMLWEFGGHARLYVETETARHQPTGGGAT
jgi:hypothetical protein